MDDSNSITLCNTGSPTVVLGDWRNVALPREGELPPDLVREIADRAADYNQGMVLDIRGNDDLLALPWEDLIVHAGKKLSTDEVKRLGPVRRASDMCYRNSLSATFAVVVFAPACTGENWQKEILRLTNCNLENVKMKSENRHVAIPYRYGTLADLVDGTLPQYTILHLVGLAPTLAQRSGRARHAIDISALVGALKDRIPTFTIYTARCETQEDRQSLHDQGRTLVTRGFHAVATHAVGTRRTGEEREAAFTALQLADYLARGYRIDQAVANTRVDYCSSQPSALQLHADASPLEAVTTSSRRRPPQTDRPRGRPNSVGEYYSGAFVGREEHIENAIEMLERGVESDPNWTPGVAIVGPEGTGKTWFAKRLYEVLHSHGFLRHLVEIHGRFDKVTLRNHLLFDGSDQERTVQANRVDYKAALASQQALLLFDNFEENLDERGRLSHEAHESFSALLQALREQDGSRIILNSTKPLPHSLQDHLALISLPPLGRLECERVAEVSRAARTTGDVLMSARIHGSSPNKSRGQPEVGWEEVLEIAGGIPGIIAQSISAGTQDARSRSIELAKDFAESAGWLEIRDGLSADSLELILASSMLESELHLELFQRVSGNKTDVGELETLRKAGLVSIWTRAGETLVAATAIWHLLHEDTNARATIAKKLVSYLGQTIELKDSETTTPPSETIRVHRIAFGEGFE